MTGDGDGDDEDDSDGVTLLLVDPAVLFRSSVRLYPDSHSTAWKGAETLPLFLRVPGALFLTLVLCICFPVCCLGSSTQ